MLIDDRNNTFFLMSKYAKLCYLNRVTFPLRS
jgi:hypothetical protein